MTGKVVIGEWPLPLPQFLFFAKKDLEKPINANLPSKLEKFTDFLKNNSIEFQYHRSYHKSQRALVRQKDYYCYEDLCKNIGLSSVFVIRHLKNPLLDYDAIVEADIKSRKDLLGYITWPVGKYNGIEVGRQFLQVHTYNENKVPVKVLLVIAPLTPEHRKHYWKMVGDGYMPIGLMSYMSWPKIDPREEKFDDRIKFIYDPDMQDIVKSFAGWLHCVRRPNRYLKYDQPRLRFSGSDLQYYITESTALLHEIPLNNRYEMRDIDILYLNIDF